MSIIVPWNYLRDFTLSLKVRFLSDPESTALLRLRRYGDESGILKFQQTLHISFKQDGRSSDFHHFPGAEVVGPW